ETSHGATEVELLRNDHDAHPPFTPICQEIHPLALASRNQSSFQTTTVLIVPAKMPCCMRSKAGRLSVVPLSTSSNHWIAVGATAWPVSQRRMSAFWLSTFCRWVDTRQ